MRVYEDDAVQEESQKIDLPMRNEHREYHKACVGFSNEAVLEWILKHRTACPDIYICFGSVVYYCRLAN